MIIFRKTAGALVGGTLFVAAPIVVIDGLGFGLPGIAAGSSAAWMMSLYSGYVAKGSLLAGLQSVGAAGMSKATITELCVAGAWLGYKAGEYIGKIVCDDGKEIIVISY